MPRPLPMLRCPPPTRQRGAGMVMAAVTMLLVVVLMALALDTGRLYLEQRRLKSMVDMAVLSGAAQAGLCGDSDGAAEVLAIANWHGFEGDDFAGGLNVHLGYLEAVDGVRRFVVDPGRPEAVWLDATREVPASLVAGGLFGQTVALRAEAVARRVPQATISAGSALALVNANDSDALNALLSALLPGVDLSLGLLTWQGLANLNLSMADLLEAGEAALGLNLGRVERLLDTEFYVDDLFRLYVRAIEQYDIGDIELSTLGSELIGGNYENMTIRLGEVLAITMPNEVERLRSEVNSLELLRVLTATIANKQHLIDLTDTLSIDTADIGVHLLSLNPRIELRVVEPPVLASGPPGWDPDTGDWHTVARAAQARVQVGLDATITLGDLLGDLGQLLNYLALGSAGVSLNLAVTTAGGMAWFDGIECPRHGGAYRTRVGADSGIVSITLGSFPALDSDEPAVPALATVSFSLLGGTVSAGLGLDVPGGTPLQEVLQFSFHDRAELPLGEFVPNETGARAGSAFGGSTGSLELDFFDQDGVEILWPLSLIVNPLLEMLNLTIDGLIRLILDRIIGMVLAPVLNELGAAVIDPLLQLLGTEIGGVEVELIDVEAGQVELVL